MDLVVGWLDIMENGENSMMSRCVLPLWGIFQNGGSGVGEQGLATPAPNRDLAACSAAAAASRLRAAAALGG